MVSKLFIGGHTYIVNDDIVDEGDWFIELNINGKRNSDKTGVPIYADIGNTGGYILTRNDGNFPFPEHCRKILRTTNTYLGWTNIGYDEDGNRLGNHPQFGNGVPVRPAFQEPTNRD